MNKKGRWRDSPRVRIKVAWIECYSYLWPWPWVAWWSTSLQPQSHRQLSDRRHNLDFSRRTDCRTTDAFLRMIHLVRATSYFDQVRSMCLESTSQMRQQCDFKPDARIACVLGFVGGWRSEHFYKYEEGRGRSFVDAGHRSMAITDILVALLYSCRRLQDVLITPLGDRKGIYTENVPGVCNICPCPCFLIDSLSIPNSLFQLWTLKVRPLAVFLSFSSFSGRARLSTILFRNQRTIPGLHHVTYLVRNRLFVFASANECMPGKRLAITSTRINTKTDLRGFDVIMEVVAECLDVRNGIHAALMREMPREKYCLLSVQAFMLQPMHCSYRRWYSRFRLYWRYVDLKGVVAQEGARCGTEPGAHSESLVGVRPRIPTAILSKVPDIFALENSYLQEDLAEYAIRLVSEYSAEYDRNSIVARFDVDGLLFAVVYCHDFASLLHPLWGWFESIFRSLCCHLLVLVEGSLIWSSHGIALE